MNMMSPPHHVSYANAMSSLVIVIGFCCSILLISVTATETITITSHSIVNFTILWVASLLGGYLFSVVKIPLLGSLVVGILLRNIFDINLPELADTIRTVSLCTILLMSSVEIDLQKLWQLGMVCVRLTSLPGMIEALVSGAFASLLFKMPFTLALGLGYILSAVSPAIVVPGMLSLKSQGLGVEKGIPSLVMAAASFDDVLAITGFTVSIGIALDTESQNIFLSAFIHGPLQLFIGVASGCLLGSLLAICRFCRKQWQCTVIAIELSIATTYFYKQVHLDGVGAVATIIMGVVASLISNHPRFVQYAKINGFASSSSYLHKIGDDLKVVWDIALRPLLFGSIGSAFDFKSLSSNVILKAFAIVIIGVTARMITAYAAVGGRNLVRSERQFISIAWIPKATVQAVLCTIPLAIVEKRMDTSENSEILTWAKQIMTTAIISILLTAPIGLMLIQWLGPRLLSKEDEEEVSVSVRSEQETPRLDSKESTSDKRVSPDSA